MHDVLQEAWRQYSPRWQAYAHRLAGCPDSGRDTVQEAIARTMRAKPTLDTPADAHRYIMCAIRTTAFSGWRLAAKTAGLGDHEPSSATTPLDRLLGDEGEVESKRLVGELLETLRRLPDPVRRAVELRFLHNPPMTFREIAEVEGCPLTTIQGRVETALRTLAELLRDDRDAR